MAQKGGQEMWPVPGFTWENNGPAPVSHSRIRFLKDGDANTSLFHQQAGFRKTKNFVPKLVMDDQIYTKQENKQDIVDLISMICWVHPSTEAPLWSWNFVPKLVKDDQIYTKQEDKQDIVDSYFHDLLGTPFHSSTSLKLEFFHTQNLLLLDLDEPISESEIWETIKDLPADQALGPDGYTSRFYKACWPIIKSDFMAAILTLHQGDARKLWMVNSAYITLIPKKEEAITPKDFLPISLIHSFGKLITKVMANRLAPIDDLINAILRRLDSMEREVAALRMPSCRCGDDGDGALHTDGGSGMLRHDGSDTSSGGDGDGSGADNMGKAAGGALASNDNVLILISTGVVSGTMAVDSGSDALTVIGDSRIANHCRKP
jgi:hypothetical protein